MHSYSYYSFHNQMLTQTLFHTCQYPRKVHPKNGMKVPLDVLAGVTEHGTCTRGEGPEVDLHIQRHPFDKHRNVNVLTMHNHFSKELVDGLPQQVNGMKFQNFEDKSNALLRVATLKPNPEIPNPLMAFGNHIDRVRLYEATPDITGFETEVLKITEWLRLFFDNVLREALEIVADILGNLDTRVANSIGIQTRKRAYQADVTSVANSPGNTPRRCTHQADEVKFPFPMGTKEESLGRADTTSSYIGRDKAFSGHSDSRLKPDLHDNETREYHEDMMDIPTQSFSFRTDPSVNVPDVILEMRHGIPKSGGDGVDYCEHIGYFSSSSDKFISSRCNSTWIPLGCEAHMHWQFPGSQGVLYHYFRPKENSKGKAIRLIMSPRKFQHLHLSEERQKKHFRKCPPVISNEKHEILRGIELLCSFSRAIPCNSIKRYKSTSMDKPEEDTRPSKPAPLSKQVAKPRKSGPLSKEASQLSRKEKACTKEVVRTTYKNADLFDFETTTRRNVIGVPLSMKPEDIARNVELARHLYMLDCSLELELDKGRGVSMVGPMVGTNKSGQTVLLRPGDQVSVNTIDASSAIRSTRYMKQVVDTNKGDTIHLRRGAKNHPSVLKNCIAIEKGQGELCEMIIRGSGGALCEAGQFPTKSNHLNAHREAPTHIVSANQKIDDPSVQTLMRCAEQQCTVNIFLHGVYICCGYVKSFEYKAMTKEEVNAEHKMYKELEKQLHELNSDAFHIENKKTTEYEIASMTSMSFFFHIEPLDRHILSKWRNVGEGEDIPWKVVRTKSKSFAQPTVHVDKDYIYNVFGIQEKCMIVNVPTLIRYAGLQSCVSPEATEFEKTEFPPYFDEAKIYRRAPFLKQKLDSTHIVSACIHCSAATWAKACGDSIEVRDQLLKLTRNDLDEDDNVIKMSPPRCLLKFEGSIEEMSSDERADDYRKLLEGHNLKPTFLRPTHPSHLSQDPTIHVATYLTASFDPRLNELNDDGSWCYRNGPMYIIGGTTKNEAEDIMVKCIICAVMTPSAILQILDIMESSINDAHFVDLFLSAASNLRWARTRLVHENFGSTWHSSKSFFDFIKTVVDGVGDLIRGLIQNHMFDRETFAQLFRKHLNSMGNVNLSDFQIQTMLRTIEMCIHEPFGMPKLVAGGAGSDDAAECFQKSWDGGGVNHAHLSISEVPQQIVEHFNYRVKKAYAGELPRTSREQIQLELQVMGLTWSTKLNCLVHSLGIGKRFDVCDAEHLLCLVHSLLQNTLPNRNMSKTTTLDKGKYHPIYYKGPRQVRDLPVMAPVMNIFDGVLDAYNSLLSDDSYLHRNLSAAYRIDFDEPAETLNPGGQVKKARLS